MNEFSSEENPDPEEMARIEAAGGEVLVYPGDCPRVYFRGGRGGLAMSRALGDEFYKQEGHILVSVLCLNFMIMFYFSDFLICRFLVMPM